MAVGTAIDLMQEDVLAGLSLPTRIRPPAAMSDEEMIALSRRNRPYRIERNPDGELEIVSPPGAQGSHWEAVAISELQRWTEFHSGISFSSNGGFTLPDGSMRSSDAAWVSEARWNALTKAQRRVYPALCPDFVIEILSATDSRKRLEAKMRMWIQNGARLAWTIDPYAATVRIYRPGKVAEMLERPDFVEAGEPVAGFRLSMPRFWDE
jgi:Uma2 family endonuclease